MLPTAHASGRGGAVTAGEDVAAGADGLSAATLAATDAGADAVTEAAGVAPTEAATDAAGEDAAWLGAVLAPGPAHATSTSPIDSRDKGVRSVTSGSSSLVSAEDSGDRAETRR
jgi:hypothetical protein